MMKSRQVPGTRKSARWQHEPPVSHLDQPQPVQPALSRPASISPSVGSKRKRLHDSEAEADESEGVRPSKQPRGLPPSNHPLSEKNLRTFNGEEMDAAVNNARPGSIKRTSSRRSIAAVSDATQETTRSQRSSDTTAFYRYKQLAAADVHIHTDPPDNIEAAINHIVQAKPPPDRCAELHSIAQELYKACKAMVKAAAGEDDFVDLFYTALKAMSPDNLLFRAKADWREELKPTIQQSDLNWNFLVNFDAVRSDRHQNVDDASTLQPPPPPPKRQQQSVDQTYISPQTSTLDALRSTPDDRPPQSDTMPPPAVRPDKVKEASPIKTPRPDISMGAKETALISALSALSSQNLHHTGARRFLDELQDTMIPSERGGSDEPALIFVPTKRASDLVFPFAVVEGKAYSTGKQVFEAQNQAAVSGAAGLKIQLGLDELVKRATSSSHVPPTPLNDPLPLFFSICIEGPYHELWAHYTHMEDGVRQFDMVLLKICHGVLLEGVEDFVVAVDNVLRWGTGPFLQSVVERLGKVARKAGA